MAKEENKFSLELCKIKHDHIDKDVDEIKRDTKTLQETNQTHNETITKLIQTLTDEIRSSHKNLKDKIILSEKTTGDKIDALNDFDQSLKGNGDPGIWECVRNIKRSLKIIMVVIFVTLLLVLGGNYRGVTLNKIREAIGMEKKEIQKVEPAHIYPEEKDKILLMPPKK
jgi:hypothetical protein